MSNEVNCIEDMLGIKEGFTPQLKIVTASVVFVNTFNRLFPHFLHPNRDYFKNEPKICYVIWRQMNPGM